MTLRAGTSASAITPPVGYPIAGSGNPATEIDDDLMTRCLILSNGGTQMALITLDFDCLPEQVAREITDRTSHATGISRNFILVATTGNSTAPALDSAGVTEQVVQRYTAYLPDIVAGNALMATSTTQEVAAGYTTLRIPNISCYRQLQTENRDIEQLETTKLLAIQDRDENVIAAVVSNPCPAIIRNPSPSWTADYPGALCWILEQSGIDAPMFVKGDTEGIMPFDWYDGNPSPSHPDHSADDANALALIIATQVAQALPRITPRRNIAPAELLAPFARAQLSAK